jgi:PAS domain S-box-containing protein
MRQALDGESVDAPVEFLTYKKDGTQLWVEVAASAIVEDGAVVGFQGISRDITARKAAEERVRFQAQLLDLVSQAVFVVDLNGQLTFWNRFAETLFGWSADELVGRNLLGSGPSKRRPEAMAVIERVARGENWTGEITVLSRDGETFPALISAAPIYDANGEVSGGVCVGTDITDLKRAEREVSQAEERAAVLRERERIAQELHDNVAQYFFGIGIAAKQTRERKPAQPAALRRRLAHIRKLSSEGGREIRNAIQALSSTELADGLDASLTRLLATFEEEAGLTSRYRNALATPLNPSTARELYAAAREALYNIRKHAAASTILVRLYAAGDCTVLEVADDGAGTAGAVTRAMEAGDGFGLRRLSERFATLGGQVAIMNSQPKGVTIRCTLPAETD